MYTKVIEIYNVVEIKIEKLGRTDKNKNILILIPMLSTYNESLTNISNKNYEFKEHRDWFRVIDYDWDFKRSQNKLTLMKKKRGK